MRKLFPNSSVKAFPINLITSASKEGKEAKPEDQRMCLSEREDLCFIISLFGVCNEDERGEIFNSHGSCKYSNLE